MINQKILVVDDELDILTLLQYNLEKSGFKTVLAKDGPRQLTLQGKRNLTL